MQTTPIATKLKRLFKASILLAVLAVGTWGAFPHLTKNQGTFTVLKSERVTTPSGESKYMVYTKEMVFENTDDIRIFKFNSADMYTNMIPGAEVTIKYYGLRIPLLSLTPNISEVK